MVSVQEVFDLAIEVDMPKMAHRIFWAISKGHVTVNCSSEKLDSIEFDEQEISGMIQSNLLSIGRVKLFVIETSSPNLYAFYYAESSLEAYGLHQQLFREKPRKITLANHLMAKIFHFNELGTHAVLYEHRRTVVSYPYYLGHAYGGENTFHRIKKGAIA